MSQAADPKGEDTKQTAKPETDGQLQKTEKSESKSVKADEEAETIIPEEILRELPPEDRKELVRLFSYISRSGPSEHPIAKKITEQHITDLIRNESEEDQRDRVERQSERNYNFKIMVTVIIALLLSCGLFMYFEEKEMLRYFVSALIGFGGGFGVGANWKKDKAK